MMSPSMRGNPGGRVRSLFRIRMAALVDVASIMAAVPA
jgi:hypothetical protein